jgi:hypothetical protein
MLTTEKKIRIIRDKLSRIGIGECALDDDTILATYGLNASGQLCGIQKSPIHSSPNTAKADPSSPK